MSRWKRKTKLYHVFPHQNKSHTKNDFENLNIVIKKKDVGIFHIFFLLSSSAAFNARHVLNVTLHNILHMHWWITVGRRAFVVRQRKTTTLIYKNIISFFSLTYITQNVLTVKSERGRRWLSCAYRGGRCGSSVRPLCLSAFRDEIFRVIKYSGRPRKFSGSHLLQPATFTLHVIRLF